MLEPPHEHLHVVLLGVLRCIDERDVAFCEHVVELRDERFRLVACFEFFEVRGRKTFERDAARVVELAEVCGRRNLFRPGVESRAVFLHAARPEAIDEDAFAIAFFSWFVDALCFQRSQVYALPLFFLQYGADSSLRQARMHHETFFLIHALDTWTLHFICMLQKNLVKMKKLPLKYRKVKDSQNIKHSDTVRFAERRHS